MSEHQTTAPSSYSSPFLLSDEEIIELGVPDHQIEQYRRKHYQNCFGIESWCTEELEPYTFKTKSVDLSYSEALALISLYRVNAKTYEKTTSLTSEEVELLENVEKRIDECLGRHTEFKGGAFVKLNTRSPKDVPWRFHTDVDYQNQLNMEIERLTERTPNTICVAFLKAMNKSMKIVNGKAALNLLGRSQRIYEDLQKNTGFGENLYESKIILREWNEEMIELPQFEFRCFVHEKRLNAISQYFCDFKFDDLIAQKEEILTKINEFFNGFCIERIPHPSFVIDFFVSPTNGVQIIEINPFHNGAGPVSYQSFNIVMTYSHKCLFSWSGANREIIMNGPQEFRIVTEEPTTEIYKNLLTIQWEKYLVSHHNINSPNFTNEKSVPTKENTNCIIC